MKILFFITLFVSIGRVAAGFELVGVITPRSSHEINGSIWSVGAETMDRNYTSYAQWKSYLSPLGVKHARLDGGWGRCEQKAGVYDWAWLDEIVFDMVLNQSIKPWIQTSFGNPIYKGGGTTGPSSPLPSGEALGPWANWVQALVLRYDQYVDEWEIWNEGDLWVSANDYGNFLITTATIIRKIQPHAKIFGQYCCKLEFLNDFLQVVSDQGQLDLINTVTYHPYSYNPDTTYDTTFLNATQILRHFSPNISLYQGENGVGNAYGGYGALTAHNWTDNTQTKWLLRRMLGDFIHGTRSSYFSIANMCYSAGLNKKGLLEVNCTDLSVTRVKPAYQSLQFLTSVFDDTIVQIDITFKVSSSSSVFGFRNLTSNTDIIAIWQPQDIPSDTNAFVNTSFSVTGMNIINPVWVDLRVGEIYQIPNENWEKNGDISSFINLPVYDSVVLVADLDALSKWH